MYVRNMLQQYKMTAKNKQKVNGVTIKIEKHIYEKLESFISEGERKDFVNELLLMNLERLKLLRQYRTPFLSFLYAENQSILVRDSKLNRVFEVKLYHIKNKDNGAIGFKCIEDDSETCVHAAYVSALPEVGKLDFSSFHQS